jgi:hypothetical protein
VDGGERKKIINKIRMVYVGGGKKRKEKKKKKINNIMIKTKSKNQNYVPNTIFFLNCDFSYETKTMYQTEFFLQS